MENNRTEIINTSRKNMIIKLKEEGRQNEIQRLIKEFEATSKIKPLYPESLCCVSNDNKNNYLHDMAICQKYAAANRNFIREYIISSLNISSINYFDTIHNYIDGANIIRKGAVSAKIGEMLLIPINMRDGSLICIGKGNSDWNESAPHGAGRLMSRRKAKEAFTLEDYEETMKDIYTTSVSQSTLDEAPMAYKPLEAITENIKDTVNIFKRITPIYNFKAGE